MVPGNHMLGVRRRSIHDERAKYTRSVLDEGIVLTNLKAVVDTTGRTMMIKGKADGDRNSKGR
jgi:hypothetical protein